MLRLLIGLIIVFSFVQCTNTSSTNEETEQARLEAERAKAEADSLKRIIEEANKGNEDGKGNASESGFPTKQVREVGKLNPVDEGQTDPSFSEFRKNLSAAIERKDLPFVVSQMHEDVKISFGAENGVEDFKKMWFDKNPDESEFWQIMKKILDLGGTWFDDSPVTFVAPYIFSTFPEDYDAFTHAAITGQGVRLRDKPTRNGKLLKSLSYEIVKWEGEGERHETIGGETYPWVKIKTLDGIEGYVFGKYIHSPIGFRAGFSKYGEEWKMKFFVAGD